MPSWTWREENHCSRLSRRERGFWRWSLEQLTERVSFFPKPGHSHPTHLLVVIIKSGCTNMVWSKVKYINPRDRHILNKYGRSAPEGDSLSKNSGRPDFKNRFRPGIDVQRGSRVQSRCVSN